MSEYTKCDDCKLEYATNFFQDYGAYLCYDCVNNRERKQIKEIRYRSNDGHYYIVARLEGNRVSFSREEGNRLLDHISMRKDSFFAMIKDEGWIEEF